LNGHIAGALRAVLFVLITLPLMPLQAIFIVLWPPMARVFPHYYHKVLARVLGFRSVVHGKLPVAGPCLIVSNHVSWIDIVVLSAVAPVSFVAKREVGTWPLFGWLSKLQRSVFVNRERRHSTRHSHSELETRIAQGDRVVLFPEGTSHDGASVLPFKSSFFAAATAPDIALVPVTLVYKHNWGLPITRRSRGTFAWYADMDLLPHVWGALCGGPLTVEIIIHPPLATEIGLNRKTACEVAERTIRRSLAAALHGRPYLE
jgi:lyso-ornithine lipid O-acyltransferase